MQNLVTSKEVSEKLKKLGVRQESLYEWVEVLEDGKTSNFHLSNRQFEKREHWAFVKGDVMGEVYAAFTISELKEPLKPYMKDLIFTPRDDIFNPDFWGNLLIYVKSNE